MSLITTQKDHYKEYYYKISANGAKLFYHRTAEGHKKIAKKDIPIDLVDSIKEFEKETDHDWMRQIAEMKKEIKEYEDKLHILPNLNLTADRYTKSKEILEQRIISRKLHIKDLEEYNARDSEKRYQEETGKYGGFEGYFKANYSKFTPKHKTENEYKSSSSSSNSSSYTESNSNKSSNKDEYKPSPIRRGTDFSELIKEGIIVDSNTPKEEAKQKYRRWLVHNHPDKGGNTELCAKIISQYEDFIM